MNWSRQIDGYCERMGPEYWAEPWNAVTNGAFIIAAGIALFLALRRGRLDGPVGWLISLVAIIGVGSFLFHTHATVWAAIMDTTPILIFILSYFAISLRCYVGFGWGRCLGLMMCFLVLLVGTSVVLRFGLETASIAVNSLSETTEENYVREAGGVAVMLVLVPLAGYLVLRSLLGLSFGKSLMALIGAAIVIALVSTLAMAVMPEVFPGMRSYLPALLGLAAVGFWLHTKDHPAGRWMLAVAAIFLVSLTLRAVDEPFCGEITRGTHWLWHILNGVVLGLLTVAVILHGRNPRAETA